MKEVDDESFFNFFKDIDFREEEIATLDEEEKEMRKKLIEI